MRSLAEENFETSYQNCLKSGSDQISHYENCFIFLMKINSFFWLNCVPSPNQPSQLFLKLQLKRELNISSNLEELIFKTSSVNFEFSHFELAFKIFCGWNIEVIGESSDTRYACLYLENIIAMLTLYSMKHLYSPLTMWPWIAVSDVLHNTDTDYIYFSPDIFLY